MRTQTIIVTRRCNQACNFCDRVRHESIDAPTEEIRAEIASAIEAGAHELVLSGGEPTLRPDLLLLIASARDLAARRIVLETNATRLSRETASALAGSGVDEVRVSVVSSDPAVHRSVVSQHTSPRHVFRGLSYLLETTLEVSIRLPIAREVPSAESRLVGLHKAFSRLKRFALVTPGEAANTLRPGQALGAAALAREIEAAWRTAQRLGVELSLAAECAVLPCTVPIEGDARRLFAAVLGREQSDPNTACQACSACALSTRCRATANQLLLAGGGAAATPIKDGQSWVHPGKNPQSRLKVLQAADVEKFFHVDFEFDDEGNGGGAHGTSRVGIIYKCNQVCAFCELADMDVHLAPGKVRAALDAARARGSTRIILTGGEPTLSRDLAAHVQYAASAGFEIVEVQTNAVLLDKPGAALALKEAGLTHAQVSLHGPDSGISDRLTAAPGTHQRTLGGVGKLLEAGVFVTLNHLIFKDNCHLLVDFVEMAAQRWGRYKDAFRIQFHSARNEFPTREEALQHIARYSDYQGHLLQAIDRGLELGLNVRDLGDPVGIPSLCIVGSNERYLGPIIDQTKVARFHRWENEWFTRVEACRSCQIASACMGVPRYYLALHGPDEFKPVILDRPRAEGAR